ncbi:unnamed protein product [Rhizoctonia solani]|uniref:UvrD-like helicase ATP-binding domain-containing protein n=1 Tax=Rhizoctonia solani TaxID=456999 RepID=A0A8H3DU57_9AGAM|nr:unnamed protein product [Rhizoctonia solani]
MIQYHYSPDEKAIVRYQGTSVVIGRSGTGKTTALVYKMRANSQAAIAEDRAEPLRQLFVTRSPVLTRRVASYYQGLLESSELANKSPEELQVMRQLNQNYQPRDLLELDNEADLRDDLPARYSELTDAHFPLFISFDKLGQLLEADALRTNDALMLARARLRRLIDFSSFKHQYWPRFDHKLTRKLDPALVFSEILGVIKGYGQDLTESEYLNLSDRKSPLLVSVRATVYAIFKAYKKHCRTRGETDTADRVREILSAHEDGVSVGLGVDYLFVDEVQDQLMADVYLLRSLCSNMDGGYWCGDTAQTINVGSSFRIKDLKAYLYKDVISNGHLVPDDFQRKISAPFSTFELTVNFRSHSGIVKYAASLVQLLYTLFPGSIDHMQPESAPIPGPKPLVFVNSSWDEDLFAECLLGRRPVDDCPPFSPEQAIIVRSEATARSLRARLKNRCNVLTLFQSKGLEFDDLILYGFFAESDSPLSDWRKVATLESYEDNGMIRFSKPLTTTSISPGVCSELKQLYVAVTRARHRCWIWDSDPTAEMMKDFWRALGLITVSGSMDSLSLFAKTSDDPRHWASRGEGFFSNGLYSVAQICFERAGWEKQAQIAGAYCHMSEAGKLPDDFPDAKSAYIVAAEKMIECTKLHSSYSTATLWYHAATCFEAAKELSRSSQAYATGGFYDRAVLVFFEAEDMAGCLDVISEYSKHIDEALLRRIKEGASIHFLRQQDYRFVQFYRYLLAYLCLIQWFKLQLVTSLSDRRLKLLYDGDLKECIELARTLRLKIQLKELLRMAQRFEELATEHLNEGSPADAVRCLVRDLGSPPSIQWSRSIISVFFWVRFGLDATHESKTRDQASLLVELYNSYDSLLDPEGLQDATIFETLITQEQISLAMSDKILGGLNSKSEAYLARVIVLQHYTLKGNRWVSPPSYDDFCTYLKIWDAYSTGFQKLKASSQDMGTYRLLGLSDASSADKSQVIVPNRTPLYDLVRKFQKESEFTGKILQNGIQMLATHVDLHIRTLFANYTKKDLIALSSNLLGSRWTQLPSSFLPSVQDKGDISFESTTKSTLLVLSTLGSAIKREHKHGASTFTKGNEEQIRIAWSMRLFSITFPLSGSVGELNHAPSRTGSTNSAVWFEGTLRLLDSLENKPAFATLLVVCAIFIAEIQPANASLANVVPSRLKRFTHSPIIKDRPGFIDDISLFFQRKSQWRIISMYKTLQRTVRNRWSMDISVLIQLIEQATREVILAERATWSTKEFSGLIAPRSWAINLAMHSAHAIPAYTLKPFSLGDFVNRMWVILVRISKRVPECWSIPAVHDGMYKSYSGFITLRLLWSIIFVMVNLRPGHESTRFVQDVLNQFISTMTKFRSSFVDGFKALGFSISSLPRDLDRESVLAALHQVYQHEEVVMLQARGSHNLPDASFGGKIIEFDTLAELRDALKSGSRPSTDNQAAEPNSQPTNTEGADGPGGSEPNAVSSNPPEISTEPEELQQNHETSETPLAIPPPRPDTPTWICDSEDTSLSLEDAVSRVSGAWRKMIKRLEQRTRFWEFNKVGRLYEKYRHYLPRLGPNASNRDKLALKLIRGPAFDIILGIKLLVEEVDDYANALSEDVPAPAPVSFAQAAISTQENIEGRRKKIEEYKSRALFCCPPNSPPKLLIAKNLMGIKEHTSQAWAVFTKVKDSGILQDSEQFKEIESLVSSGRNVIIGSIERLRQIPGHPGGSL